MLKELDDDNDQCGETMIQIRDRHIIIVDQKLNVKPHQMSFFSLVRSLFLVVIMNYPEIIIIHNNNDQPKNKN